MKILRALKIAIVCVALSLVVVACSDGKESSSKKSRREATKDSETTSKKDTLPSLSTTTPPSNLDTKPITELPYVAATEIANKWSESKICALISATEVQKVLGMASVPTPEFYFSEATGSRCSYSSGSGDEIYIEFSNQPYGDARAVDTALNAEGKTLVVDGVGGVTKTNKATGVTYELNFSGSNANEWIVNGPDDDKTNKIAKLLIKAIS